METFLLKLVVAVVPLVILVASVTVSSELSSRHTRSRHRRCRPMLRAVVPVVALIALATISTGVARNTEHDRTTAAPHLQPVPEFPVGSVSSMMNGLYAASGR